MSNKREKSKSRTKNRYNLRIQEYINRTDSIKEIISKKKVDYASFDLKLSPKNFNKEELIKTSNSRKSKEIIKRIKSELFTPMKDEKKYPIHHNLKIFNRPLSGDIMPCKVISISKKNGSRNHLILDINYLKNFTSEQKSIRKCLSFENNSKSKKVKLKTFEDFSNYFKGKTPIDLLVEEKGRAYDNKFTKNKMSNKKILETFYKKYFKNERDNFFLNKYFYIKSRLKTKNSKKNFKSTDKALNFDDKKYKLFQNISKSLKHKIKLSSKKLDVKKIIEELKKKENLKNRVRIAKLKEDIEDEKILLTPRNFLIYKQDPFTSYKINKLVQALNSDFTYKNRFILSKKFGIKLDKFLLKTEQSKKNKNNRSEKMF